MHVEKMAAGVCQPSVLPGLLLSLVPMAAGSAAG